MRYKIVNVVAFAILNAFTLRKEEEDEDFVVGGVLLRDDDALLFKDDEKRAVDKDATEFETIEDIYILLEERMHNELFESTTKKEKKEDVLENIKNFFRRKKA